MSVWVSGVILWRVVNLPVNRRDKCEMFEDLIKVIEVYVNYLRLKVYFPSRASKSSFPLILLPLKFKKIIKS